MKNNHSFKRILVTGAAGYIGGMLVDRLLELFPDAHIIGIDLLPQPTDRAWPSHRVSWIQADLATNDWQAAAQSDGAIDAVVHCAFRIRTPLGKESAYRKNNCDAAHNTFVFAFENARQSLVYLSTVSSYGARKENIGRLLTESDPLLESKNPYGIHKKLIEEDLASLIKEKNPTLPITVLRLNSVTGPRGQHLSSKFGLITFLKKLLPFVIELNPHWARQFVHEDDVVDAIIASLNRTSPPVVAQYNIAPRQFLEVADIARILHKKILRLPPWTMRIALAILWPITGGKLVPPGAADGLIYPINVNGSAIEKDLGFVYHYTAQQALEGLVGRYKENAHTSIA